MALVVGGERLFIPYRRFRHVHSKGDWSEEETNQPPNQLLPKLLRRDQTGMVHATKTTTAY